MPNGGRAAILFRQSILSARKSAVRTIRWRKGFEVSGARSPLASATLMDSQILSILPCSFERVRPEGSVMELGSLFAKMFLKLLPSLADVIAAENPDSMYGCTNFAKK